MAMKGEPVKLLGRGRPKDSPRTRGLKKLLRTSFWHALRRGDFEHDPDLAYDLDPNGEAINLDRTSKRDVDHVTAAILGKGHGVRKIQAARKREPITSPDEWHAFAAALRWLNRKE
jgi:hypothetical protein